MVGKGQANSAVGAWKRRPRGPWTRHLGAEHPAVLADRDRCHHFRAHGELDRPSKRKGQVDRDLGGRQVEHAYAPHEVARVQDRLVAARMVVGDGDLHRAFARAELFK